MLRSKPSLWQGLLVVLVHWDAQSARAVTFILNSCWYELPSLSDVMGLISEASLSDWHNLVPQLSIGRVFWQ